MRVFASAMLAVSAWLVARICSSVGFSSLRRDQDFRAIDFARALFSVFLWRIVIKATSATAKIANMPTMRPIMVPMLILLVLAPALVEVGVEEALSVIVVGGAVEDMVSVGTAMPEIVPDRVESISREFEEPVETDKVTSPEGSCLR